MKTRFKQWAFASVIFVALASGQLSEVGIAADKSVVSAGNAIEFDDCNGAGWCPGMLTIPAGSFVIGSPLDEQGRFDDETQHVVRVKEFAIGKYLITRGRLLVFARF
jgi:formylglycine-generating enzyme required for sulfatase activity